MKAGVKTAALTALFSILLFAADPQGSGNVTAGAPKKDSQTQVTDTAASPTTAPSNANSSVNDAIKNAKTNALGEKIVGAARLATMPMWLEPKTFWPLRCGMRQN
jgi:hypothetical protein